MPRRNKLFLFGILYSFFPCPYAFARCPQPSPSHL